MQCSIIMLLDHGPKNGHFLTPPVDLTYKKVCSFMNTSASKALVLKK